MFILYDSKDFGAVTGFEWYRWFVGISYESVPAGRSVCLRFGPLYLHLIRPTL